MAAPPRDPTLVRRRRVERLALLKRRVTLASVLGFAAFFGLAAQHAVKGTSSTSKATATSRAAAGARPTTFFDEASGDFAFGSDESGTGEGAVAPQSSAPPPPPVAQTSVS